MQVQIVSNIRMPNLKYIYYLILQFIRSFHASSAERPACVTKTFTKKLTSFIHTGITHSLVLALTVPRDSVVWILSILYCWHYIKTTNICAIS